MPEDKVYPPHYGRKTTPALRKRQDDGVTALDIWVEIDGLIKDGAIHQILKQGGAIMIGQTRDNKKLILTVYLDGDNEKEYCDDVADANTFLGAYRV